MKRMTSHLSAITACQQAIERHLDLNMVLDIARSVPSLPIFNQPITNEIAVSPPAVRIGVLRDRAFTFYYPENLEALENAGAELVFIDAFHDTELPPIDALYIGGGFPEMFIEELFANVVLRVTIREVIENDLPVYAECGGLMYLSQRIRWGQKSVEMVGALPCEVEMTGKPQGHGYVNAEVDNENPFFALGTVLRGHEFHNSRLLALSADGSKLLNQLTVFHEEMALERAATVSFTATCWLHIPTCTAAAHRIGPLVWFARRTNIRKHTRG